MSDKESVMEKPKGTLPNVRLKHERECRGWSQNELAQRVSTDPKVVSRWERGKATPSKFLQRRLCELFEKSAVELGFLEEEVSERSRPMAAPSLGDQGVSLENI